jgi:CRP-like cAMP-binding protein
MSAAHQDLMRRRRRTAAALREDGVYGVSVRSVAGAHELVWRPASDAAAALAQVRGLDSQLEHLVGRLVWEARRLGTSWQDIASLLGYSRPAVQRRYRAHCDRLDSESRGR